MKIAIAGGGPGGLYLAALMKGLDPRHEVTVWERNAPDETFGFGVVFSDETLGGIEGADPVVHDQMERRFARWTDIDITDLPVGRRAASGDAVHGRRAGVRGDEPQGPAAGPPGPGGGTGRGRPLPHAGAGRRAAARHARPGGRRRRRQLRDPHAGRGRVRPRHRPAGEQVHLARHRPGLRGVPVLRQADAVGDHADPRLPVLRRGLDVHRGNARAGVARRRVRQDGAGRLPAGRQR